MTGIRILLLLLATALLSAPLNSQSLSWLLTDGPYGGSIISAVEGDDGSICAATARSGAGKELSKRDNMVWSLTGPCSPPDFTTCG